MTLMNKYGAGGEKLELEVCNAEAGETVIEVLEILCSLEIL